MIELDGSFGEGGGQILRTALSLSCVIGTPFCIINIRKNRSRPGLQPQHLMAVKALTSVCQAGVEGDKIGSDTLVFTPQKAVPGDYSFDIGTAGSTGLLLQALLPPLIFADGPSTVRLKGGTHVSMSPPFDYLQSVFCAFLEIVGATEDVSMERCGFYPHGGGRISAFTVPVPKGQSLQPVHFIKPGMRQRVEGVSAVGDLPISIAERQRDVAIHVLRAGGLETKVETRSLSTDGPGTYIFLLLRRHGECPAGFSSIGARGKRAEVVGSEASQELLSHIGSGACLDPHLADQVLIYLSLAADQSVFTTSMVTEHLLTNLSVIRKFLPMSFKVEGRRGHPGTVTINGIGHRR